MNTEHKNSFQILTSDLLQRIVHTHFNYEMFRSVALLSKDTYALMKLLLENPRLWHALSSKILCEDTIKISELLEIKPYSVEYNNVLKNICRCNNISDILTQNNDVLTCRVIYASGNLGKILITESLIRQEDKYKLTSRDIEIIHGITLPIFTSPETSAKTSKILCETIQNYPEIFIVINVSI